MRQQLPLFICLILFIGGSNLVAQDLPLTRSAVDFYLEKNLEEAKPLIDEAILSEYENTDPYTWSARGFIYKELYKSQDGMSRNSENRDVAVESTIRSIELDVDRKYYDNNKKAITYLAATYFNDALDCAKNQELEIIEQSLSFYKKFAEASLVIEPNKDLSSFEKDIYKQMAGTFQNIYLNDQTQDAMLDKAIENFKQALEIDEKDYESNYNLAVNYYNRGVKKISLINHKTPIHELMMIQEDCIDLFRLSLPYMLEAHAQTEDRVEPLKGLMAIYKALNEEDQSNYYQERLEEIVQSD